MLSFDIAYESKSQECSVIRVSLTGQLTGIVSQSQGKAEPFPRPTARAMISLRKEPAFVSESDRLR